MPPLPPRDLSLAEVEWLLRDSEGRTSVYRENEGAGHADARHYALTKADLWHRPDIEGRSGKIALFTAFVSRADMAAALRDALNSEEGKWARNQFSQGAATARHPKGSHNGMSATIHHFGVPRIVRYAGGTGTLPVSTYVLILARDDSRPLGLHVKTFYGTVPLEMPESRVIVKGRDNSPFSQGP